ncbi:MAG: ABC transporter, partial [Proteobacteria bacterium]|nr:ABC transporter [Pseudomonadota bacterium]
RDEETMVRVLLRISQDDGTADQRALEREVLEILDSYYAVPLKEMDIGRLLLSITDMLRLHRLKLPPDLVIMSKAFVTAEGTARFIYPDLNIVEEAREHITHLMMQRFRPAALWRGFRSSLAQFINLQQELPRRIEEVINRAERGKLTIGFRHENLGGLMNTLDNITNRLTLAIILAAMIVASSMIITTGIGPLLFGFPALGIVGYLISGMLGLWLVFNILRWRKF